MPTNASVIVDQAASQTALETSGSLRNTVMTIRMEQSPCRPGSPPPPLPYSLFLIAKNDKDNPPRVGASVNNDSAYGRHELSPTREAGFLGTGSQIATLSSFDGGLGAIFPGERLRRATVAL